jgi:hypothetical protein
MWNSVTPAVNYPELLEQFLVGGLSKTQGMDESSSISFSFFLGDF